MISIMIWFINTFQVIEIRCVFPERFYKSFNHPYYLFPARRLSFMLTMSAVRTLRWGISGRALYLIIIRISTIYIRSRRVSVTFCCSWTFWRWTPSTSFLQMTGPMIWLGTHYCSQSHYNFTFKSFTTNSIFKF